MLPPSTPARRVHRVRLHRRKTIPSLCRPAASVSRMFCFFFFFSIRPYEALQVQRRRRRRRRHTGKLIWCPPPPRCPGLPGRRQNPVTYAIAVLHVIVSPPPTTAPHGLHILFPVYFIAPSVPSPRRNGFVFTETRLLVTQATTTTIALIIIASRAGLLRPPTVFFSNESKCVTTIPPDRLERRVVRTDWYCIVLHRTSFWPGDSTALCARPKKPCISCTFSVYSFDLSHVFVSPSTFDTHTCFEYSTWRILKTARGHAELYRTMRKSKRSNIVDNIYVLRRPSIIVYYLFIDKWWRIVIVLIYNPFDVPTHNVYECTEFKLNLMKN